MRKHPGHTKEYTKKWKRIRAVNNQIGSLTGDVQTMDTGIKTVLSTRSEATGGKPRYTHIVLESTTPEEIENVLEVYRAEGIKYIEV